jgi:hypothetical protein
LFIKELGICEEKFTVNFWMDVKTNLLVQVSIETKNIDDKKKYKIFSCLGIKLFEKYGVSTSNKDKKDKHSRQLNRIWWFESTIIELVYSEYHMPEPISKDLYIVYIVYKQNNPSDNL